MEVDVSEGTFTLFLRYLYGSKMDVEEIAELEALVEIHSLACQFEQGELREEVVGKLRNLLNKESRGLCEVVELRNLLFKHKVEELVPLVKESQVKAEDLEELLAIATTSGSQSKVRCPFVFGAVILKPCAKVAEEMVVRYLNSACPTTRPQRDQEFSIPGFPGRDFAKSRDPGIFQDGISLKFQSRDFREL